MGKLPAIQRFDASNGARIYRIPMLVFPNGFIGFSYVVMNNGAPVLVDCGSGFGESSAHLMQGLAALKDEFGEALTPQDIDSILVTHGHIDHFGGVSQIAEQIHARIGIHPLDRRVLINYEERMAMATKQLRIYLESAGTSVQRREQMIGVYAMLKQHVRSVPVDFDLDEDAALPGMRIIHTPGHCPGQVCILIGDVLLSGDHELPQTTPHQAPESITHYTGLGHYRESLRKIAQVDGIRLALGGHETPITDFYGRVQEIQDDHDRKLNWVLDIIKQAERPCTIDEITLTMYPDKQGFETLLAIEEAGAHVEYLYQYGVISVANLDEVVREDNPALRYTTT